MHCGFCFFRNGSTTGAILNTVGLAAIIYTYFRMLSRNIQKRYAENQKYLSMTAKSDSGSEKKKYDGTEKNTSYLYLSQLRTENQDPQGKRKN